MIVPQLDPSVDPQIPPIPDWIDDALVEIALRDLLEEYTTPRRGHSDRLCWPIDEIAAEGAL